MTVTLIDLDPNTTPVRVTIQRKTMGSLTQNGVISSGVFGISGSVAYFDTNGATSGEGAALGYDGSVDRLFLKSSTIEDAGAIHLMQAHELARLARREGWKRAGTEPVETSATRPARPWESLGRPHTGDPMLVGTPARPWRPREM